MSKTGLPDLNRKFPRPKTVKARLEEKKRLDAIDKINEEKPEAYARWTRVRLLAKIRYTTNCIEEFDVDAWVLEPYSVYVEVDCFPRRYVVRSLLTGRRILLCIKELDAIHIAEALLDHCPLMCRNKTKEELLARAPKWVEPWVIQCMRAEGWVDLPSEVTGVYPVSSTIATVALEPTTIVETIEPTMGPTENHNAEANT